MKKYSHGPVTPVAPPVSTPVEPVVGSPPPPARPRTPSPRRLPEVAGAAALARGLVTERRRPRPSPPATVALAEPTPAPLPEPTPEPLPDPVETPGPEVAARAVEQVPAVYRFRPMRLSRMLLSLALLGGLALTGWFGLAAYQARDSASIGIAAICALATAVLWAIRAGAAVDELVVRSGQLEVVRQGGRYVFDLASTWTAVEVHGRPGQKRWRVLFPRRGMSPFVVDASMVDPRDFMRVLLFFRPDVPQFKK